MTASRPTSQPESGALARPATVPLARQTGGADPVARIDGGTLAHGDRTLWRDVDLAVAPGEFIAILGANGSGKSSLLHALLGGQRLTAGRVTIAGRPVARGSRLVGYIPQRIALDPAVSLTARDLVRLGVDGHRWGLGLTSRRQARTRADELLADVDASHLAAAPVSQLSGGELQRVRVAEALGGRPRLILADEPLAALDVAQAGRVIDLLDRYRTREGAAVLLVTHDINAVLGVADRVLYLAGGSYRLGPLDEVLTSASLTDLYGAPVDVFRTGGRIVVVATTDPGADHDEAAPHRPLPKTGGVL